MNSIIDYLFLEPKDTQKEFLNYYKPAAFGYLLSSVAHFSFAIWYFLLGVNVMVLYNVGSTGFFIFCYYLHKHKIFYIAFILLSIEFSIHAFLSIHYIGYQSGFQFSLIALIVFCTFLPFSKDLFKIISMIFILFVYSIIHYYAITNKPIYYFETSTFIYLQFYNIIILIGGCGLLAYFHNYIARKLENALDQEYKKSEMLLLNILPEKIAERLKRDQTIIADKFENVSILFLDIVDFTKLSENFPPHIVVSFLNDLFSICDELTDKYNLEKIKTIGDAYMVAAGIPEPCEDHAERIANLSVELKNAIHKYNIKNGSNIKVRMGINSGPAVAGVIGKKKFAYDIWGDTVNTASRMETYGQPNKIQVTKSTYDLLKDKFAFINRGIINVKGKGELSAYFLNA